MENDIAKVKGDLELLQPDTVYERVFIRPQRPQRPPTPLQRLERGGGNPMTDAEIKAELDLENAQRADPKTILALTEDELGPKKPKTEGPNGPNLSLLTLFRG